MFVFDVIQCYCIYIKERKISKIRNKRFLSIQTARYQNTKRLNLNIKIISAVGHLEKSYYTLLAAYEDAYIVLNMCVKDKNLLNTTQISINLMNVFK